MTCAQYYTYAQLEQLWINAGGDASVAPIAAAIAEAESGGCVNAAYPGTTVPIGQGSWNDATGLWQILGAPAGNFTRADLTSATGNASMAVAKYQQAGNSFTPWQTYTSGAYTAYVSNSTTPDPNVPASPAGSASNATLTSASTSVPGSAAIAITVPLVGPVTLLSKSQARGLIGGALILAGGLIALPGLVVLLVAVGGPGARAAAAVRQVPVAGKLAGAGVAALG